MRRHLFTDKYNSVFHFLFGVIAFQSSIVIPIFIIYQFRHKYNENTIIDILEFLIGYGLTALYFLVTNKRR